MKIAHYLLCLFLSIPLYAQYDNAILKVHATILPKIIFMDYNFKQKTEDDKVLITLICERNYNGEAVQFKQMIENKYKNGINGYTIDIKVVNYENIKTDIAKSTIYYLFPISENEIRKVVKILQDSEVMIFSSDKNDLSFGSDISINIGKKIKPILNMGSLKKKNIRLHSALINISEIYYKKSDK